MLAKKIIEEEKPRKQRVRIPSRSLPDWTLYKIFTALGGGGKISKP